jgi:hypothetical protein
MAKRQAIVRKSDGLIVNVVISPDTGFPFELPPEYEVIDAPEGQGLELGNEVDTTQPSRPVKRNLQREEADVLTQLKLIRDRNPAERARLEDMHAKIRQKAQANIEEARREFESLVLKLRPKGGV